MKIAMFTNTYLPHVGGVAKSIHTLETELRALGHEVRVIAPEFEGSEPSPHVLRVPAIQNFNGSDFCVRLPFPNLIRDFMDEFQPDIIHSHHPFLLGDSALRESWKSGVPILFTHHTLYERYTHYVPLDSPALKRVAVQMATEYCNLCDRIIAPSASVANLLRERGVLTNIVEIPTGIDLAAYSKGDGDHFREAHSIPMAAKVIGHVGRLAKEKNLLFLAEAVSETMKKNPGSVFLLVGEGDATDEVLEILKKEVEQGRVYHVGKKAGKDLVDAYTAMDLFVFASQTETQGMVLAEAMAAGKPVVALDGPGVREILHHGQNGYMLPAGAKVEDFTATLGKLLADENLLRRFAEGAAKVVKDYGTDCCVAKILECYDQIAANQAESREKDPSPWDRLLNGMEIEWELLAAKVSAASAAVILTKSTEAGFD